MFFVEHESHESHEYASRFALATVRMKTYERSDVYLLPLAPAGGERVSCYPCYSWSKEKYADDMFFVEHELHESHEYASRFALATVRIVILFLCEVINSSSENRICNHHKYSGASTLRKRAHRVARPFYIIMV